MRLFEWLIVAHLVGDYLVQTEFEAMNKAVGPFWNKALWSHCAKYTASFLPVFWFMGVNPLWILVIFASHLFLDRRWPIIWWREHVTRNSVASIQATLWLTVVLDQIFHLLVIVVIVATCQGAR